MEHKPKKILVQVVVDSGGGVSSIYDLPRDSKEAEAAIKLISTAWGWDEDNKPTTVGAE
jgi:hypothetical protein